MDKIDRANQWFTLITNIGVMAGLFFLIIEVSQNTVAIENQVDVAVYGDAPIRLLVENPDLAELHVRSETESWEDFSAIEQERLGALWALSLDSAELQYRLRRRSDEPLTAENIAFPQRLLSRDSFMTFWRESEQTGVLAPDFVSFFNSYLDEREN